MNQWRKQLEDHQQALRRLLLRRTPERFDDSEKSKQLKKEIQTWNKRTRQLVEAAPRAQQHLPELSALGAMRYTTLTEVKAQLRLRGDLITKVLGQGKRQTKPTPLKVRPAARGGYRYDFCLSFAGEDREFATRINHELRRKGYRTFFDQNREAQTRLLGQHGPDVLHEVFYRESQLCLLFISQSYKENVWPSFERKSIQQRQLEQGDGYIIPIRLDDSELPGFHTTTGYLKRRQGMPSIVRNVIDKLREARKGTSSTQASGDIKPHLVVKRRVAQPKGHQVLLENRVYTAQVTRGDSLQVIIRTRKMQELTYLRAIQAKKNSWTPIRFAEHFSGQDMQVTAYSETTDVMGRTVVTVGLQTTGQHPRRLYADPQEVGLRLRQLLLGEEAPKSAFVDPKDSVIALAAASTTSLLETARLAQLLAAYFVGRDHLIETVDLISFKVKGKSIVVRFQGTAKSYLGESTKISISETVPFVRQRCA